MLPLVVLSVLGITYATSDRPTPAEFEALLHLDYKTFDQSEGGFRTIADDVEAGRILDAYLVQNHRVLKAGEARLLAWHAGQKYAMADLRRVAIARFERAFDPNPATKEARAWNSYVKGSIAFLKRDRLALEDAITQLRRLTATDTNLRIMESFARCFDKGYREAYSVSCGG